MLTEGEFACILLSVNLLSQLWYISRFHYGLWLHPALLSTTGMGTHILCSVSPASSSTRLPLSMHYARESCPFLAVLRWLLVLCWRDSVEVWGAGLSSGGSFRACIGMVRGRTSAVTLAVDEAGVGQLRTLELATFAGQSWGVGEALGRKFVLYLEGLQSEYVEYFVGAHLRMIIQSYFLRQIRWTLNICMLDNVLLFLDKTKSRNHCCVLLSGKQSSKWNDYV